MPEGYNFLGWRLTPAVKYLIAINVIVFLFTTLVIPFISYIYPTGGHLFNIIITWLALTPLRVIYNLALWQLITYMFLHGDIFHILFNMLALWMFGGTIESYWGTKKFLIYYFLTGIGAGLCSIGVSFILGYPGLPVIGASGAIYGLLLAFGMLFPDAIILVLLLFPMKAKYAVMIFGAVEFLSSFQVSGVSHIAHLGGMIFGFIYIRNQYFFDNLMDFEKRKKKKIEKIFIKREADCQEIQKQADKILEKISIHGMDSISDKEKAVLDKASKLLKEKNDNIINLEEYRRYWR